MTALMIGVDPAKRSNTIEVIDSNETVLVTARFENTNEDYRKMRTLVKRCLSGSGRLRARLVWACISRAVDL